MDALGILLLVLLACWLMGGEPDARSGGCGVNTNKRTPRPTPKVIGRRKAERCDD